MVLKIEITQSPAGIGVSQPSQTFSEQGGSIGRGDDNTWILQDPDKFLSSRHCELSNEGGVFYLTDTSTNGTFFNGAAEPIGRGSRVALNPGDVFELGDYKFSVELEGAADPFSPAPLDPFDVPASPFDSPETPPLPTDDFFSSPAPSFEAEPLGPSETDPLAALDKAAPVSDPFSAPADPFVQQQPAQQGAESFPYGQNTFGDGAGDPMAASFEPPKVSSDGVIPENWEEDEDWLNSGPQVSPANANTGAFPESPPAPPPPAPPRPRRAPAPTPQASVSNTGSFEIEPRRDISQPNAVTPKRKPRPSAKSDRAPTGAQAKLARLLVDSMGLDGKNLSAGEHVEITEQVGELMPVIVQGMMNILRSRASIKNEFRMSVTTIQPVENNPLKFSADTQEALENMFVRKSKAYKGPVEAFSESFDAIAEHQVAIIAGIRAAFESMLEQFNPQSLEHQFDKHSKGVAIPGMQKVRYWTQYEAHYQSVIDNMEQSFQSLFGDEFVRAYEDQLFKLVSARNKI